VKFAMCQQCPTLVRDFILKAVAKGMKCVPQLLLVLAPLFLSEVRCFGSLFLKILLEFKE